MRPVALLGKSSAAGSSAVTPISMEPLHEFTYKGNRKDLKNQQGLLKLPQHHLMSPEVFQHFLERCNETETMTTIKKKTILKEKVGTEEQQQQLKHLSSEVKRDALC